MNFVKIETSDSEIRWINLDQVLRVTSAREPSGDELLVIFFGDVAPKSTLKIHGATPEDRTAIDHLKSCLDAHVAQAMCP